MVGGDWEGAGTGGVRSFQRDSLHWEQSSSQSAELGAARWSVQKPRVYIYSEIFRMVARL